MGRGKLTLYSLVLQAPPLCSSTINRPYSRVSPAFVPRRQLTLVMLADKHTRNVCSLPTPSDHKARGVPAQDTLARTPLCPVPSSIHLSTPPPRPPSDGHFTPRPERSDYPANE
ncbi:hypothetical protein O181_098964 [Austropuccinia psidii MF-1]|uniref:Uncharacterized protein n=1 Tax=Austropuccinia psidii MF-1 TaxID=1389203 RepID=A0A9Q3PF15_9BASI|nr:hypothetical protein [Austropuccinia psidii MF-1]